MKRRHFLRTGSLAGIALSATAISSFAKSNDKEDAAGDFDLNETTLDALQQMMQKGKLLRHQSLPCTCNALKP